MLRSHVEVLCAARAGQQADFSLGKTDQVVTVFGDAEVASEGELEGPSKGGTGNRGDDRLGHALAQCHCLVEEPAVVGRVVPAIGDRTRSPLRRIR